MPIPSRLHVTIFVSFYHAYFKIKRQLSIPHLVRTSQFQLLGLSSLLANVGPQNRSYHVPFLENVHVMLTWTLQFPHSTRINDTIRLSVPVLYFNFSNVSISIPHDEFVRTCFFMIYHSDAICIHKKAGCVTSLTIPQTNVPNMLAGTLTRMTSLRRCGRNVVNILQHEAQMNHVSKYNFYLTESQSVSITVSSQLMLFGVNNRCLLSEWYELYQYIVWKNAESSNNKAVDTT